MIRLTWRLGRWPIAGFTTLSMLIVAINSGGYSQIAGTTDAEHRAFARGMTALGAQLTYLLPVPERLDTAGGYLEWRAFGGLVIFFALWGVFAGTAATRLDEDRGLLEQWLAAGISRARIVATRTCAYVAVLAAALALTDLAAWLTAAGNSLTIAGIAAQSLALLVLTLVCFGLGMVAGQFAARRRTAAALASLAMLVLFFLNSLGRQDESLRTYRWISPFYLYDRSHAMVPGGQLDLPATVAMALQAGLLIVAAWLLFERRDLGAGLIHGSRGHNRRPLPELQRRALRTPVIRRLYEERLGLAAWSAGVFAMSAVVAQTAKPAVEALGSFPNMRYLLGADGDPVLGYLSTGWSGITGILLAAFAITVVAGWSSEDGGGRLEMLLSQPYSRRKVVFERALAALAGTVGLTCAALLGLVVVAKAAGIVLPGRSILAAFLMSVPFTLAFAAVGAAAAALRPRAAIGFLSTVAVLSYLVLFLGPLFKVPDWVLNLSVFKLYGRPLAAGLYWQGLVALVAIVGTGFAAATAFLERREVGT